jgi:pimeloyl-ACP methyl ester carboxylesterase
MPLVLVHGVPETDAIWAPLVDALGRDDAIRLSPPGFGAPVPDGFEPVRTSYVDWLISEVEAIAAGTDGPIDLVGHDWGALHVLGLVGHRVELLRSWAVDVAGIAHPEYEWHDMAQVWRTPEEGEEMIDGMMGASLDEKEAMFESLGMPPAIGRRVAEGNDETMGRCILALYRSAGSESRQQLWDALPAASARPGLVLIPTEDHFAGEPRLYEEVAARAGATTTRIEGQGHWWMTSDPTASADALTAFWAGLD